MSQSWPPQQGWPTEQPHQPPTNGAPGSYGYSEGGYGQAGPTSRGQGGAWPPQHDGGWGQAAGSQMPEQYPQRPYQQGPYTGSQYQPGGYTPGGYPQAPYPQHPYIQDQYAQGVNNPYGPPAGYGAPMPPVQRRSAAWLLPLVLVVLAILVVGGGVYAMTRTQPKASTSATAQLPTGTAAQGVPAGFKLYSDDSAHAQLALPQEWTTKGTISGSQGLLAISQEQNSFLLAKSYPFVGDKVGAANGAISGGAGSGTVANKTGPTNVDLAGETWVQEAADITRDGVELHIVVLVTTHGDQTYLLGYYSTPQAFDAANTAYFQPAVQSFAFTK